MISVIGLEIHAELLTETKIFCTCKNSFGGEANVRVCPVCAGFPGTLPLLNRKAVTLAVRAGLALGCKINNYSSFDRKNYFYPDLPKAYQITQFEHPICGEGTLKAGEKSYRITRIHLEEDAGKLIHTGGLSKADYNRCGVPLIEIVTEPDFRSGEEVQCFVEEIARRLKYAQVCDARLEQGSLRVDVNISVMPEDSDKPGTRTEIKNLNSYKFIKKAIEYESKRQTEIIRSGKEVIRETLRFDGEKTISMRSKEDACDYRYFPEPDIPPIFISDSEIAAIGKALPRLPHERISEYVNSFGLSEPDAALIAQDKAFSDLYEAAVRICPEYRETAKLMLGSLSRELNKAESGSIPVSAEMIAELVKMICSRTVSRNAANDIMSVMFASGGSPQEIAEKSGMIMESGTNALEALADRVIAENPKAVSDYKNGNKKSFGYLMGRLMGYAGKSADPQAAKDILMHKLN